MIVDAHVNVDSQRFPIEVTLEVLHNARIASAVIFADPEAADIAEQNRYVLQVAREHGLYPFYYLGGNPWTDTRPDSLEVPSNLEDYAGIRWHRWIGEDIDLHGIPNHSELEWTIQLMESAEFEAVVAGAAYYNLPVIVEESLAVTVEFATRFPSLDFIIPYLGARNGGQANILRALWDQPNVYFSTGLSFIEEATLSRVGVERMLFSSGYPYGNPETELDKIDRLPIPEDAKEGMYGDNLVSLLSTHTPSEL